MTDHRTAETAHGTVHYETVPCSHCDIDVTTREAVSITLGGEVTNTYSSRSKIKIKGDDIEITHLCPLCADSIFGYAGDSRAIDLSEIRRYQFAQTIYQNRWLICLTIIVALSFLLLVSVSVGLPPMS